MMQNQILNLIKLNFDYDDFYSIDIKKDAIYLQGKIDNEIITKYIKMGYVFKFEDFRYVAKLNNIIITFM
ncbi:MAG: hypothetical protein ACR2IM_02475 [Sediminibacterium sp.]